VDSVPKLVAVPDHGQDARATAEVDFVPEQRAVPAGSAFLARTGNFLAGTTNSIARIGDFLARIVSRSLATESTENREELGLRKAGIILSLCALCALCGQKFRLRS